MNADNRDGAGEAQQSFTPSQGDAGVRRSGLMPTANNVPQRTAFRPVTGTQPTTGAPGSGMPPTGTNPTGAQRAGMPVTGAAPTATTPTGTSRTGVAPSGVTPTGSAATTGAPVRSVTASAGVGRASSVHPRGGAAGAVSGEGEAASAKPIGPRKVRVLLSRIDPWSALKLGFLLSIALGIMFVIAMHILWTALNSMGTIDLINDWVQRLFTTEQEVNILQFINYGKVMSATLLVAVSNVVLISGLSVIGALLYNVVSRVVGGVYVTLTDD